MKFIAVFKAALRLVTEAKIVNEKRWGKYFPAESLYKGLVTTGPYFLKKGVIFMGIKPFIPDKVYEILRWVVCTVLPEAITLYGVIGHVCDIPHTAAVLTIMGATEAFLAGIFMFNKIAYDARMKRDIEELSEGVEEDE